MLRPLEPLDLPESEEVTVTIVEEPSVEEGGQLGPAFDVESALAEAKRRVEALSERENPLGLLSDWGGPLTRETIDEARRESWASFPRDFPSEG